MSTLETTITEVSERLRGLEPGPLAELRRMVPGGNGTPVFWRLAVTHEFDQGRIGVWQRIIQVMAVLSAKGLPETRPHLHDRKRSLGAVLCDGGNRGWEPPAGNAPRPMLSEHRLARFLAVPAQARGEALERLARMLAGSRDPASGINCAEIAGLLLNPGDPAALHRIARDYYARLDWASRASLKEGTA